MVKGRINHALLHPHLLCDIQHLLFDLRIKNNARLKLDIDRHIGRLYQLIDLFQRRDSLYAKLWEMLVDIDLFKLFIREVFYPAGRPADAVDCFIVNHHKPPVPGFLHIQLDSVSA